MEDEGRGESARSPARPFTTTFVVVRADGRTKHEFEADGPS